MTAPSSNPRAGFLIVLLAAVFAYGLIRAFSIGDVYPGITIVRPPDLVEIQMSSAVAICALRVAGNLACRRAFRPPGGLKARLQPGLAATQQRCDSTQFPQPANSPGTRSGDLIVLLAAAFAYGLIRAFSIGDVYPGITSALAQPRGTVA